MKLIVCIIHFCLVPCSIVPEEKYEITFIPVKFYFWMICVVGLFNHYHAGVLVRRSCGIFFCDLRDIRDTLKLLNKACRYHGSSRIAKGQITVRGVRDQDAL